LVVGEVKQWSVFIVCVQNCGTSISYKTVVTSPRWCFDLIVVRGFEYARDPDSYTSGSVATGRAYLAGQVKG
jgi:hypothetical protein